MKRVAQFIHKHPFWFVGLVVIFPVVLAVGMYFPWFKYAKGEANAWLGFWGSYLGGLVSGIVTFAGVYYGFNLQREENKNRELFRHYSEVFTVFTWCEDMLKYLDGTYKWDSKRVQELTDKARDSYSAFLVIDANWYKRFQAILADGTISSIEYYGLEKITEADKGQYRKLIDDFRKDIVEYIKIRN